MYIYSDYNLCYSLMKEINPTSSAIWVVLVFKPVFMCYSSFFINVSIFLWFQF